MFIIENRGQAIHHTNYWQSDHAAAGYVYLSWNAGAARLLIPDSSTPMLKEMRGATEVIVSRGPWPEQGRAEAIELLWEDGSDTPFVIQLVAEQCDRLIPDAEQGGGFIVAAWSPAGIQGQWPGKYRRVDRLPCFQPWSDQ